MKKNVQYRYALPALLALVMLAACKTRKVPPQELPEKTAFYTIGVFRDTTRQLTTFKLLNVNVVDTKINYRPDEAKARQKDYLKFEILTKNAAPVIAYTEHPLFKKFDLYQETGEISSKLVSLPKGQVTIRVPYYEDYTSVKITETIDFKTFKPAVLRHEK